LNLSLIKFILNFFIIIQDVSDFDRAWIEKASKSDALETIVRAGEILFIPSHWFHYITSLQKSAQCNTRSGVELDGTEEYGNRETVQRCT